MEEEPKIEPTQNNDSTDMIIEAKNVSFVYNRGKENEFQALVNVSCKIYPEEFIIFFGPSGCGKSTLLNVIAGLEKPDSGSIIVMGKDLMTMTNNEHAFYHRKKVGMIYQQYNLIASLSVLDNVALPQIFINARKGRRNKWSRQLLDRFGILEHAKKIPTELSGGQQQRIGIARSIVNNPKIILADEPVGNLDSVSAENVLEILGELNEKEKKTVILVTHNPEYLSYGDRILYMKDGMITHEVVNHDKNKKKKKLGEGLKTTATEINDLMRAYQGLTPEQINILIMPYKAKAFAHHFIASRNMEETRILEDAIQRRLLGSISEEEFYKVLNRSSDRGGVGFDRRTAEKVVRRVNRIIRNAYFVYRDSRQKKDEAGKHIKISDKEKAEKITAYLLKTCYYKYLDNLEEKQVARLNQTVEDRIVAKIQKAAFFKALDLPFSDGGAGLNTKTARAITEELELILILGFGVAQLMHEKEIKEKEGKTGRKTEGEKKAEEIIKNAISGSALHQEIEDTLEAESREAEKGRANLKQLKDLADKYENENDEDAVSINNGANKPPASNYQSSIVGKPEDKEEQPGEENKEKVEAVAVSKNPSREFNKK